MFFCVVLDIGSAAHASPISARVRVDDVDPNTDTGARIVLRRIERAAGEVCGQSVARRYLTVRRTYRLCALRTMARAVDQVGAERLQDVFRARYGHI
jgi:UrcA family protein